MLGKVEMLILSRGRRWQTLRVIMFVIPTEETIRQQPFMGLSLDDLHKFVGTFVAMQCPTDSEDDSHGHAHMQTVAHLSVQFAQFLGQPPWYLHVVAIVGWLHDVADHKLPDPLRNQRSEALDGFLRSMTTDRNHTAWFRQIIDWISFSKENTIRKNGGPLVDGTDEPVIWRETIGNIGTTVRNIVSDADKSQALFEIGIWRCYIHTITRHPKASEQEVLNIMKQHGDEKLFRLVKDHFIRTPPGIVYCQKGTDILRDGIEHLALLANQPEKYQELLYKFRHSSTST